MFPNCNVAEGHQRMSLLGVAQGMERSPTSTTKKGSDAPVGPKNAPFRRRIWKNTLESLVSAVAAALVGPVLDVLRSEEHTSELQSHSDLVCRLLLEKKKKYDIKLLI